MDAERRQQCPLLYIYYNAPCSIVAFVSTRGANKDDDSLEIS